ncbi:uncharacterized protein BHQ10_003263 [Talaromyces amestolkiae]|uniref:Uncharacterized protein n=1 Tax=Talaromyces amestolkiae TaxID=1196081 RepID=A0A364KUT0_TALAM|nr:uncharacterized protein BHQ10_003263 [Talaromyces amestolkiae]RAO67251.1 hypothetical protein BHQ10_003263 [Talaromyces amestolkiae]
MRYKKLLLNVLRQMSISCLWISQIWLAWLKQHRFSGSTIPSSIHSVEAVVVLTWDTRRESALHLLINNAGVMCVPYEETKDGFEMQLAVNYVGHFLLTRLMLPILVTTSKSAHEGEVRIVNVSSDGHGKLAPKEGIVFSDPNLKRYSVWTRYGHSKLANVLHANELAKRYGEIMSISLHPGTVKTNLSKGPLLSTPLYRLIKPIVELGAPGPRKGATNILFAAVSTSLDIKSHNGAYLLPGGKVSEPSNTAKDPRMAFNLWEWTEKELKARGIVFNK